MLRLGLEVADRIVAALPSRVAYALADFGGDLWHRAAPARRRLVAANLARVCAATGRPTSGRPFARLVRSAFRNHARYYVELMRAPHYPLERIDEFVDVPGWPEFDDALRRGPGILVGGHLGNFEPFGSFVAAQGTAPVVADRGDRAARALRVPRGPARREQRRPGEACARRPARSSAGCGRGAWWASSVTATWTATGSR